MLSVFHGNVQGWQNVEKVNVKKEKKQVHEIKHPFVTY